MTAVHSDEVRLPRRARQAVSRHERVVVLNRERPVLVIVHPDDVDPAAERHRGRRVGDIAAALAAAPAPDPDFAADMDAVLASIGDTEANPWERS